LKHVSIALCETQHRPTRIACVRYRRHVSFNYVIICVSNI